jgi:hypothetical protein
MATQAEIAKIIAVLADAYPSFRPGRTGAEVEAKLKSMTRSYYWALGDLDANRLMQAAHNLVRANTFFPSAAELAQTYYDMADLASGIPSAPEAWAEVKALFRRGFSRYNKPTVESVSHPRVWKALEGIGGWMALCDSENDAADRARYLQAYETYTERDQEIERMHPETRKAIADLSKRLKSDSVLKLGPAEGK